MAGEALVHKGSIKPAEAIVVLSGSSSGNRIKSGIKLFKDGLGEFIIISGHEIYPGTAIHVLMKKIAVEFGVPEKKIIVNEIKGETSTWGEAITNLRALKENQIKSFILVTSHYHSQRSHMIYKTLISDLNYDFKWSVYPAKDPKVPLKNWWDTRAGRIAIFLEYLKILNFFIEH